MRTREIEPRVAEKEELLARGGRRSRAEALATLTADPKAFDLLITDFDNLSKLGTDPVGRSEHGLRAGDSRRLRASLSHAPTISR